MRDLEPCIENWRQKMAGQEAIMPDELDELEDHLRTEIASLKEKGLSGEESFWLAKKRLGKPEDLGNEYCKVNHSSVWAGRLWWITGGILAYQFASTIYNIFTRLAGLYTTAYTKSAVIGTLLYGILWISFHVCIVLSIRYFIKGSEAGSPAGWIRTFRQKYRLALILVVSVLVLAPAGNQLLNIALSRNIPMDNLSVYYQVNGVFNMAYSTLVPVFWGLLLVWLNRKRITLSGN